MQRSDRRIDNTFVERLSHDRGRESSLFAVLWYGLVARRIDSIVAPALLETARIQLNSESCEQSWVVRISNAYGFRRLSFSHPLSERLVLHGFSR